MKPSILEAARGLFRLPRTEKGAIDPKAPAACLQEYRGFVASLKQNREEKLIRTHKQTQTQMRRRRSQRSSQVTPNINRQVINGEGKQAERAGGRKKKIRVERGRRGEKIKIVQLLGKHVFSLFLNK